MIGDQNELGESVQLFSLFPKPASPKNLRPSRHRNERRFFGPGSQLARSRGTLIEQLLRKTRGLKPFHYESGLLSNSDYGLYAPFLCISFLRKYTLETLEKLTLMDPPGLVSDNKKDMDEDMDITTLRDFRVLWYAAVETSLFVDNNESDQHEKNIAEYHNHEQEPDEEVSRLVVDVLPPALETVVLHTPRNDNDLASMFRDLSQHKHK
ncbi:MAG: hypothetical protein L6R42_002886 [Xanthoria sp. 1 TBL-2021]|nr:MAG: hypothetical protein L6R42_002886 [Xanthoria sp. 1 TBL-2021]